MAYAAFGPVHSEGNSTSDTGMAGRRTVIFPTRMNLAKLGRDDNVQAALETARNSAVVTVLPKVRKVEGGRLMQIPLEAGYGVSEVLVNYAGA